MKQSDDQAWPPVKVTNFINLALVKDNTSWKQTVQRSVDELVKEKEPITYQQIFHDLSDLKFQIIFIEGRPGSGKTTLMTKVSQDWASGQLLPSKELIFLIPLHRLNGYNKRNLSTLIEVACHESFKKDEIESLEHDVQAENGENIVFIFDGFDEYSPIRDDDIVLKLMKGFRSFLPRALIVVSSRPAACDKYREFTGKEIEVLGFLKKDIIQYVQCYYSDNKQRAKQLLKCLEQLPNLMNMCYLPLHCAMLVFIYDKFTNLPTTETEFYKLFTLSTLRRSLCRRKDRQDYTFLTSFDQLSLEDKALFDEVCKFALIATVKRKPVFTGSELKKIGLKFGNTKSDETPHESCLGLVVIGQCLTYYGPDKTYTFLHLKFQEFLAAVYMYMFPKKLEDVSEQYQLDMDDCLRIYVVYKFLCGLTGPNPSDIFYEIERKAKVDDLHIIRCACESQQHREYLFDFLIRNRDGTIKVKQFSSDLETSDVPAFTMLLNNHLCWRIEFPEIILTKFVISNQEHNCHKLLLFVEVF